MALKYRGKCIYCYESVRTGKSVRSIYLGSGEVAVAVAKIQEYEREKQRAALEAREENVRLEKQALNELDGQVTSYYELVDKILSFTLTKCGYYLHKRTWRPRRMTPEQRSQKIMEYQDFCQRLARGDESALPLLKRIFDDFPDFHLKVCRGDLAERVKEAILDRVAGKHLAAREAMRRVAEQVRKDLAGPCPSPIEAILAERCSLLHLAVHESELSSLKTMNLLSLKEAEFFDKRCERAHRKYCSALKSLALVKQMLAIAEQRRNNSAKAVPSPSKVTPKTGETPT
jgi:hypothetical protein